MFDLIKKIMPREEAFFAMFERHAAVLQAGSRTLRQIMEGGANVNALCNQLIQQENEADAISHEVLQAIRKTFITPFDRSDIKGLITAMDDAIDQMNKTAKAILMFEVKAFESPMREMGDLIVASAAKTAEAVPLLRAMKANSGRLHSLTGEIVRLEEESDHVHEQGLKALYVKSRKDPMAYIVGAEIYEHLEKVVDRFEDVANTISGIVIEHL
jgi:predicted phosphate transport protein (TIGR00153 family)